jgi:hypothetical protein
VIEFLFDVEDLACAVCGCTEDHACEGGCSWACEDPAVCTACLDGTDLEEVLVRVAICEQFQEPVRLAWTRD